MHDIFRRFANRTSAIAGSSYAFLGSIVIIAVWAFSGKQFEYSDTWQLVINTGTTIITFLMVFLIQNTQNRDARAIHLKLDELLRAVKGASPSMVNIEEMTDADLAEMQQRYRLLHDNYDAVMKQRKARAQGVHKIQDNSN